MAQVPLGASSAKNVLDKQHLGRTGLEGEVLLRVLAFLAAERRVGEDDVKLLRSLVEQRAIGRPARQRVAVPEIGLVDPVQHEVGQRDGNDEVLLLAPKEGVVLQGLKIGAEGRSAQLAGNVLVGDGKKPARAATRGHRRSGQAGDRPYAPWRE